MNVLGLNAEPLFDICDGERGSFMGFEVDGHVDESLDELILASYLPEFIDAYEETDWVYHHGFEVERVWRDRQGTIVNEPTDGAIAVTQYLVAQVWTGPDQDAPLLCVNHPEEPAVMAFPNERVGNPRPEDVASGYTHFCAPCAEGFDHRYRAVIAHILREQAEQKEPT